MKNRNSYERLKSIQTSLAELSKSLDEQYCKMRQECMDEIIEDRKEHVTKKNEMYSLYEKISESNSMRITLIKNKLPWYIAKFCKISSTEMSLRGTSIFIGVNFGKSCEPNCYVEITPRDIGWI
jgi:hypothetical protein